MYHLAVNTATETMDVSTSQDVLLDPKEWALGRLSHKLLLVTGKEEECHLEYEGILKYKEKTKHKCI